jgi:hypothetical protein
MFHSFHPSKKLILSLLLAFVLLSLADLFLTWKLIRQENERVIESNPIAGWWLDTYGWGGMTAFKLGAIAMIGGLTAGIACRRPRTAELILVFACGAQSAVAMHSVFLGRFLDVPRLGPTDEASRLPWANLPDNNRLLLLTQKSVQEELQLSESQVKEFLRMSNQRQEIRNGSRGWTREEWNATVQQLLEYETALLAGLLPKQTERLQQIALQRRVPSALADADVAERLRLTEAQKEQIRAVQEEARAARRPPWGHGRASPDEGRRPESFGVGTSDRLLLMLTEEQKAHWEQMLGTPFKGEIRWERPPGRPPRPDSRRPRMEIKGDAELSANQKAG